MWIDYKDGSRKELVVADDKSARVELLSKEIGRLNKQVSDLRRELANAKYALRKIAGLTESWK